MGAPATVKIGQDVYGVCHAFSDVRVIINYEGAYVLADFVVSSFGKSWELSGEPANPEERAMLEELVQPFEDTTVVTVEAPE